VYPAYPDPSFDPPGGRQVKACFAPAHARASERGVSDAGRFSPLTDQAALHGLLNGIRHLGPPLLSVHGSGPNSKRSEEDGECKRIISLVLKAVALCMAFVSIILGLLPEAADISTQVTLLSVGLFTLSLDALQKA
jgi:hypothetical protein